MLTEKYVEKLLWLFFAILQFFPDFFTVSCVSMHVSVDAITVFEYIKARLHPQPEDGHEAEAEDEHAQFEDGEGATPLGAVADELLADDLHQADV